MTKANKEQRSYEDLSEKEKKYLAKRAKETLESDFPYFAGASMVLTSKGAKKQVGVTGYDAVQGYFARTLLDSKDLVVQEAAKQILYALAMGEKMDNKKMAAIFQSHLASSIVNAKRKDLSRFLGTKKPGIFKRNKTVASIKDEESRSAAVSGALMVSQLKGQSEAYNAAGQNLAERVSPYLMAA